MARSTRSLTTDIFISVLLLAAAGFFGRLFWIEFNQEAENTGGVEVGKVAVVQGQAERRYQRQTRWSGVRGDEPVYNLDAVRTGPDSGAVLELLYTGDGGDEKRDEIILGPDTYIVLDLLGEARNIRFVGGDLSASGSEGLTVSAGDTIVTVDSGSVSVGRREGVETSITVIEGAARVNTAGGETLVDNRTSLLVDETSGAASRIEVEVTPVSPKANALLLTYGTERVVDFSWNLLADWATPVLEVSTDPAFNGSIIPVERTPAVSTATLTLSPARYYWRISDPQSGAAGPVSLFTIDTERPAEPTSPAAGTVIPYRGTVPPVNLQWNRAYFADAYTVELGRSASIAEPLISREVTGGSLLAEGLDEGTWWWRVTPRYRRAALDRPPEPAPRSFILEERTGHEAPRLIAPANGLSLAGQDVRDGIDFSWRTESDIISYTVTVARNEAFTDIAAAAQNIDGRALLLPAAVPGTYFWRVDATAADGLEVPPSETRSLTVRRITGSVELIDPAPEVSRELEPFAPYEFIWRSDIDGTRRFTLERVQDGGRTKIIESLVNGDRFTAPLPGEGTYLWRVQVLDSAGRTLMESVEGLFRLRSEFSPPVLIQPPPGSSVSLVGATTLTLGWNPSPGADAYRVVLKSPAGDIVARDDRVTGLNRDFPLENAGTTGTWTVELTSLRDNPAAGGSRTSETAAYRFTIGDLVRYSAAALRAPADGASIDARSAILNGVALRWEQSPPLGRYTVEVASDGETRLYQTTEPSLILRGLDAGTYRWLVRSRDRFGQEAPESVSSSFRIGQLPVPGRPVPVFPESGADIDMTRRGSLEFSWLPVEGADFYDLALYAEGSNTPFWRQEDLRGSSFTLRDLSILDVGSFVLTILARSEYPDVNEVRTGPVARIPFSLSVNIASEAPKILTEQLQYAD